MKGMASGDMFDCLPLKHKDKMICLESSYCRYLSDKVRVCMKGQNIDGQYELDQLMRY